MKPKLNNHAPRDRGRGIAFANARMSPAGLMEAIWDTSFALATATAIYLGVASLAGHVSAAQAARNAGIESGKQVGMMSNGRSSPSVSRAGERASQFD
jgi:hypothetical protein